MIKVTGSQKNAQSEIPAHEVAPSIPKNDSSSQKIGHVAQDAFSNLSPPSPLESKKAGFSVFGLLSSILFKKDEDGPESSEEGSGTDTDTAGSFRDFETDSEEEICTDSEEGSGTDTDTTGSFRDFETGGDEEICTDSEEENWTDEDLFLLSNVHESSSSSSQEIPSKIVKTTDKTDQTGKSLFGKFKANLIAIGVGASAAVMKVKGINKDAEVDKAQKEMMGALNDPLFVLLSEKIAELAWPPIENVLNQPSDPILSSIYNQKKLIKNIFESNLALGFANLAKKIAANKDGIPNFDNQPTLVSLLSLILQDTSAHIDTDRLSNIEEKYRPIREKLKTLTKELSLDNPDSQTLICEYLKNKDDGKKMDLIQKIFPGYIKDTKIRQDMFLNRLDQLKRHNEELRAVFVKLSDVLVRELFPNAVEDLKFPGAFLTHIPGVADRIYKLINDLLTDTLLEFYLPLENDLTQTTEWVNSLSSYTGNQDITPFIAAPAALLQGLAANFVKTDPKAIKMIAGILAGPSEQSSASSSSSSSADQEDENVKKELILAQVSQENLANYVIESIQSIQNTEDQNFLGLGKFVQQIFNKLTLALMANGTKLVFEENESIPADQFLNELADRLTKNIQATHSNEALTDEFWKKFVPQLPIPLVLQNNLINLLIEQTKFYQNQLLQPSQAVTDTVDLNERDTAAIIFSYKGGSEILSIIDRLTDVIINSLVDANVNLVKEGKLSDSLVDLLDEYLPGIKIDAQLAASIQENLKAFSKSEKGAAGLLKGQLKEVFREAMITTIETSFANDSQAFAAQLLNALQEKFSTVFATYDEHSRNEILSGQTILAEIRKKEAEIEALQSPLPSDSIDLNLPADQKAQLENLKLAIHRAVRADKYAKNLEDSLTSIFAKLNSNSFDNHIWDLRDILKNPESGLSIIDEASFLYRQNLSILKTSEQKERFISQLEDNRTNQVLISLINMSSDRLNLVREALQTSDTLIHAWQENELIKNLYLKTKAEFDQFDHQVVGDRQAWETAIQRQGNLFNKEARIAHLSEEIKRLETGLESCLKLFQDLSEELASLMGLGSNQKENLALPPILRDQIWPLIETAKKTSLARLLFTHITPLLLPVFDIPLNQAKLTEMTQDNSLLSHICALGSKELIKHIPEFVTSYKPFATRILATMGISPSSANEIERMERALHYAMVLLGKQGVTAAMLKPMIMQLDHNSKASTASKTQLEAEADLINQALINSLTAKNFKPFTKGQILTELRKVKKATGEKAIADLDKKAATLTYELNQFLASRGKPKLSAEVIMIAYNSQIDEFQTRYTGTDEKEKIEALNQNGVVEEIKKVVITPEEIAHSLNDLIPGAKDLHALIAPELQAIIVGEDHSFEQNRGLIQQYAEGMLLRTFLVVAKANNVEGQDISITLTEKLKHLELSAKELVGKNDEEIAHYMVDKVISDVIGIASQEDFKGIPLPLQKLAYDKLKELFYQEVTPFLMPIVERTKNRTKLNQLSGSPFLSTLSQALTQDLLKFVPSKVADYQPIAAEMFNLLFDPPASDELIDQIAEEIATLVRNSDQVKLSNEALLNVLVDAAGIDDLKTDQFNAFKDQLEQQDFIAKISAIWITPESIMKSIQESLLPQMPYETQATLAQGIHNFTHDQSTAFQNISAFAHSYIDGVLLNIFTGLAQKNRPTKDKDSMLVATEKLLHVLTKKYQALGKKESFESIAKQLEKEVMETVFGISSPESLKGLPPALQKKVFDLIQDKLAGTLINLYASLKKAENDGKEVKAAKTGLSNKKFGPLNKNSKSNGEVLTNDIGEFVFSMLPGLLTERSGTELKIVNTITKNLEIFLEDLAYGDSQLGKELLKYTKAPQYQKLLSESLITIAGSPEMLKNKDKAVEMISNLIAVPLNTLLQKAMKLEEKRGEELDLKLLENVLGAVADHFKTVNLAKEIALKKGHDEMLHADFVEALQGKAHPGLILKAVDYKETLDFIYANIDTSQLDKEQVDKWAKSRVTLRTALQNLVTRENQGIENINLKNILAIISNTYLKATGQKLSVSTLGKITIGQNTKGIGLKKIYRDEASKPNEQRDREANNPAARNILEAIFPNKEKDLFFLSDEFKGISWELFEKSFTAAFPSIIDNLDATNFTKMVISGLDATSDTLNEDIPSGDDSTKNVGAKPNPNRPLDAIDTLMGDILFEGLKNVKLPAMIKNRIVDPKTGISDSMKRSIGNSLREQFNGMFIRKIIPKALEGLAKRDPKTGDFALKFDPGSQNVSKAEALKNKKKMEAELRRASRQVVDSAISFFIRSTWADVHKMIDAAIRKVFGNVGVKLKHAIDLLFRIIFIKIVGTILSILLWPVKRIIKEIIYRLASLDFNVNTLLDFVRMVPKDQPLDEKHGIYNEDMFYKMAAAIHKTLNEEINSPKKA